MSAGRAPLPVPPTLIVCTVPAALMLKWMVSLTPNTPGFWLLMSVSAPAVPLLIAWIASRSDTLPSLGVLSSDVVVTLMTAGARRASSCSRCKGRRRGRRAFPGGGGGPSRENQEGMGTPRPEATKAVADGMARRNGESVRSRRVESKRNLGGLGKMANQVVNLISTRACRPRCWPARAAAAPGCGLGSAAKKPGAPGGAPGWVRGGAQALFGLRPEARQ